MKSFEKLLAITQALWRTFPDGNSPYQIMTRLMEECGELAEQVHIFERDGVKPEKHGEPDPSKMTKEIQDVMICALQVAVYYDLMAALEEAIDKRVGAWLANGALKQEDLGRFGVVDWPPRNVLCAGMVVAHEDRVLLVRQAAGTSLAGQWSVPWGVVEVGETADVAAVRETLEEGGIMAAIQGLLGVQNLEWESATALAFLGRHVSGEPTPDGVETDMAAYFSLEALAALDDPVEPWSEWLVRRVLAGNYSVIEQNEAGPFRGAAFL
jgi:ADP-ribose pyrophosphatase YjhB (NUDIX family)/NTP pyrophosphatase (non-canonical NTP hydrolase)